MAETKNDEQKLQVLINKFDPELKLHQLKDLSYSQLVNWIRSIQKTIDDFKEGWRSKIEDRTKENLSPAYKASYQNDTSLVRCFDEERFHLNNPFGLARFNTPRDEKRGLYFYTYPFNEYIAYQVAKAMDWYTPETKLAMIESTAFFNLLDEPKEKICSVQKKIEGAVDPFEYTLSFFKKNAERPIKETLELFQETIDEQAFEDAFLFTCMVGEISGSPSKYQLVAKDKKMAFVKTNNSTCFSSNYFETDSFLVAFPQINKTLSKANQDKLLAFNEEPILELMKYYGKDLGAIACFRDRVRAMKSFVKDKSLQPFAQIGARRRPWKVESFLLKLYHEGIAFT